MERNKSAVIQVLIDELKRMQVEEEPSDFRPKSFGAKQYSTTQRVFRDYILSSEPFLLENSLN
jgi:hypothetical protein